MPKISELPSASIIDGTELLLLVKDGANAKAAVGNVQLLESFGGLPTGHPLGSIIYVIDAKGGARPMFWDGSMWRIMGTPKTRGEVEGEGIWYVGVGACTGPAQQAGLHQGVYFTSEDGFNWVINTFVDELTELSFMNEGTDNSAYANGCWVVGGLHNNAARIVSTLDPRDNKLWEIENFGADGSRSSPASSYNNDTGIFVVPITPGPNVNVTNEVPPSDTPDTKGWPRNGVEALGPSAVGMGTQGPVEVRINAVTMNITAAMFADPTFGMTGAFPTHQIQARRLGTSDWQTVHPPLLGAGVVQSAGLGLNGLVWGTVADLSVEFAAGAT
jgi:hypothetical protein